MLTTELLPITNNSVKVVIKFNKEKPTDKLKNEKQ